MSTLSAGDVMTIIYQNNGHKTTPNAMGVLKEGVESQLSFGLPVCCSLGNVYQEGLPLLLTALK